MHEIYLQKFILKVLEFNFLIIGGKKDCILAMLVLMSEMNETHCHFSSSYFNSFYTLQPVKLK